MFKWGVSEELVPPSVHQALQSVPGLRRGRADVRESEPVRPVADASVDPIQPYVARQVWAMVELQRLTGMRPGEVCTMRTKDIDTSGAVGRTPRQATRRSIMAGSAAFISAHKPKRFSDPGSGTTRAICSPHRTRWLSVGPICEPNGKRGSNPRNWTGPRNDRQRSPAICTLRRVIVGRLPTESSRRTSSESSKGNRRFHPGIPTNSGIRPRPGFVRNSDWMWPGPSWGIPLRW